MLMGIWVWRFMPYVIKLKNIPETHQNGFQNLATSGLAFGLCLMLILEV